MPKRIDFTMDGLADFIDERIKKAFNDVAVPTGYEKCAKCGTLKLIAKPCPYCTPDDTDTEPITDEKRGQDGVDKGYGIISIIDDSEEDNDNAGQE